MEDMSWAHPKHSATTAAASCRVENLNCRPASCHTHGQVAESPLPILVEIVPVDVLRAFRFHHEAPLI